MIFICLNSKPSCHILHKSYQEPVTKVKINLHGHRDGKYMPLNLLILEDNLHVVYDTGYPHDGRANKDSYPHDGGANKDSYPHDCLADKDSYPHDRHNQYIVKFIIMVIFWHR